MDPQPNNMEGQEGFQMVQTEFYAMGTTESLAIEEVQPQAAAQAAAIEEVQPQAAAQAAAATSAVVATHAVVAVPVAGGTLSTRVPSYIPALEFPVLSYEEIADYQGRLMHYGLDQNPKGGSRTLMNGL
jgi:hypothetical protein